MPFGVKPMCTTCKNTNSTMWRKGGRGEVLCNSCGLKQLGGKERPNSPIAASLDPIVVAVNCVKTEPKNNVKNTETTNSEKPMALRKSSRIKPARSKSQTGMSKSISTKGKSRRIIFKKNPVKSHISVSTITTTDYVYHQGIYYQVGDIVSLLDEDGGLYYAQVRGFLQDQFAEKSAVITWLIPTVKTRNIHEYDPATFILGPEEDLPRKMEYLDFVCHAPSDYYKSHTTPYPTMPSKQELGYIWTSLGGEIRALPTTDEIFGSRSDTETESVG